jgi:cell division protein DivIC
MKKPIQQKIDSEDTRRKNTKNNRRRYLTALIFLVIFTIIGFAMVNIVSLKMQEAEAATLNQKLLQERERLKAELALVDNPLYIEQQARMKLRMIKPGETLYVFPDELTTSTAIEENKD